MERRNDTLVFDHLGGTAGRDICLNTLIKLSVDALKEGEKLYPLIEVARITDRKYANMLQLLKSEAIQINPAGGYCGYDTYIKTWNAIVIESLVKDDFGFPVESDVIKAKTIILENSHPDFGNYEEYYVKELNIKNVGSCATIFNLKEIDRNYIFECLKNAENIIIPTEAQDKEQLNGFMKLFLSLPKKNIYISCEPKTKAKITSHELFVENSKIHDIKFS